MAVRRRKVRRGGPLGRSRVVAWMVVGAAAGTACTDADEPPSSERESSVTTSVESPGEAADPVAVDFDPELALADGEVTEPEMRAAIEAIVDCVEDGGFSASAEFDGSLEEGWTFDVGDSRHAAERLSACRAVALTPLEQQWFLSGSADLDERSTAILECLMAAGHAVDGMSAAEALQAVGAAVFAACDPRNQQS